MNIKLRTMTLNNFKGIDRFALSLDGYGAIVRGRNGTGKTTLKDAFLWLLFGKDSEGRSDSNPDFPIKTIAPDGCVIPMLDHEVEARLEINGKPATLRRLYREVWKKKRGSASEEFSGHETLYWINEVPTKAGEYTQYIESLMDEKLFRLLTSPLFFHNEKQFPWQERRAALLEMCGEPSSDDIITADSSLSELISILEGRTIEQQRKVISDRIRKLNAEIESIPIRIDELTRSMPVLRDDYTMLENQLETLKREHLDLDMEITGVSALTSRIKEKIAAAGRIRNELEKTRSRMDREADAEGLDIVRKQQEAQRNLDDAGRRVEYLKCSIAAKENKVAVDKKKLGELRGEWERINAQQLIAPDENDLSCPTCGQLLPEGQRSELIGKSLEQQEKQKHKALSEITNDGKALSETVKLLDRQLAEDQMEMSALNERIITIGITFQGLNQAILDYTHKGKPQPDYMSNNEYARLTAELEVLESEINQHEDTQLPILMARRAEKQQAIDELKSILSNREIAEQNKLRIEELMEQERDIAGQIAEQERQRYMLENYIKVQTKLLEEKINDRFSIVKFKLFEQQINGGVEPCCEATINGVPYKGANSAAQINAGLDIINALSEHYGVRVPIFVDHGESVCELYSIDTQVVSLIVDAAYAKLNVELLENKKEEVA